MGQDFTNPASRFQGRNSRGKTWDKTLFVPVHGLYQLAARLWDEELFRQLPMPDQGQEIAPRCKAPLHGPGKPGPQPQAIIERLQQ